MSPEVLAKNYTKKCDIWSVGILLYVMLSGCLPFYGATDRDTAKLISAGKFAMPDRTWKHVPNAAKDLVQQLLRFDPNKRPCANEALKHPWLHQEECPIPLPPSIFSSMREFVAMDRFRQLARFVMAEHVRGRSMFCCARNTAITLHIAFEYTRYRRLRSYDFEMRSNVLMWTTRAQYQQRSCRMR